MKQAVVAAVALNLPPPVTQGALFVLDNHSASNGRFTFRPADLQQII